MDVDRTVDDNRAEDSLTHTAMLSEKEEHDSTSLSTVTTPSVQTTAVREKTPEDIAERVSTDVIVDAVSEILATPTSASLPSVVIETKTTETIQHEDKTPTIHDTAIQNEAERLSTEALTEALRKIIATPTAVPDSSTEQTPAISSTKIVVPMVKVTTTTTTVTDETSPSTEQSSIAIDQNLATDSLTETVHQILATPVSVHLPSIDSAIKETTTDMEEQEDELLESTKTSTVTETMNETTPDDYETKEIEAERLSTEALTEAVREILSTPVTVHLPSTEHTTETTTQIHQLHEEPADQSETIISTPSTTTDVKDALPESSDTTFVTEKKQETEAENLTSSALTEAVREILATPLTVHLPSIDTSSEEITTRVEEQPTPIKEENRLTSDTPSDVTETVQTTTSDNRRSSVEAERLSSDALTEAVREILSTPLTVHLPSVDSTNEEQVEKLSAVPSTSHPKEVESTVALQETAAEEKEEPSSVHETVQEAPSKDLQSYIDEVIKENEAERLSSDALTEAVREILATPLNVHLPSVHVESETTEIVPEQLTTSQETTDNDITTTTEVPILKKTTTTTTVVEQSLTDVEETKDDESISTDSLTETVRQILATPVPIHLPSIDHTTESTTSVEQEVETPELETTKTVESTYPSVKTNDEVHPETSQETVVEDRQLSTPVDSKKEEDRIPSETLNEVVQKVLTATLIHQLPSLISTTEKTTTQTEVQDEKPVEIKDVETSEPDTKQEVESDRLSSEALIEAVREILATPLTVHLPSVETTTEKTTTLSEVAEKEHSLSAEENEILESNLVPSVSKTAEETRTEKHQLSVEDKSKEVESERFSSEALTEAVREILATPLTVHLPSSEITTETVESTEQSLPITTADTTQKIDKISDESILKKTTTTTTTTTTDSEQSTDEIKKDNEKVDETVSTDALSETVRQILATPVTVHLPLIETETKTIEEQSDLSSSLNTTADVEPSSYEKTQTISSDLPTEINRESTTAPVVDESAEKETVLTENGQTPIESTDIVTKEQFNDELSVQDSISSTNLRTIASESEVSFRPISSTRSISPSEDESLHDDDDNQSVSSSLYAAVDNIVTDAIVDACYLLEQPSPDKTDNESLVSYPSSTDVSEKVDIGKNLTDEPVTESREDYPSISGLTNIVQSVLNTPNAISSEVTLPHEDNKIIVSDQPTYDEQPSTSELTNIVQNIPKTLNTEISLSGQSQITEETPLRRASAVTPTFKIDYVDDDDDDQPKDAPTFFVPGTPTFSETDFQDLYENRHFVSPATEESDLEFSPVSRQDSVQSTVQTEEKKVIPDSKLAYYELQEERHTLMSPQQSVSNEKDETESSSLTTWTTVQPLTDFEPTEKDDKKSDINLDDQAYEVARRFDLASPSVISNLPTSSYHQVFGVSEDIANTMDHITEHVSQILSKEQENSAESITSDEIPTSLTLKVVDSVSDNVKKITEALDALESDLLEESSAPSELDQSATDEENRLKTDLSTSVQNDIRQTLEDRSVVVPTQNELFEKDLLPKQTKQETVDTISNDETASDNELDSRYTTLLDRIDSLEKPLLDVQATPTLNIEKETITTETEVPIEDDDRHLHQRFDTLIDRVNSLEEATHENLVSDIADTDKETITSSSDDRITTSKDEKPTESDVNTDGLAQTMAQILATPFRTVTNQYEKLTEEERNNDSGLETTVEQMLATTQYPTPNIKLSAPVDTITSTDEAQKVESEGEATTSITSDEKVESSQEEEKDSASILNKATSVATNIISSIASALPTRTTSEEINGTTDTSLFDKQNEQAEISTATTVETTTTNESSSTDVETTRSVAPEEKNEQESTSSTGLIDTIKSFLPSALRSHKSDEVTTKEISSPVAGYFTSNDVYHAYKRPFEPVVEEQNVPSITDRATSIVKSAIKSATDILPASSTTETSTTEERVSTPQIEEKEEVDEQQTSSSTGLLGIMKSLLPSSLRTTKTDVESTVENEKEISISSPVPGYFSSSDVYHAYKQPVEPVVEEKDSSSIVDVATSMTSNITSSATDTVSTSQTAVTPTTEEHVSSSQLEEEEEEVAEQQTPSSAGLLGMMKSLFPSSLRTTEEDVVSSEDDSESTIESEKEISVSSEYLSSTDTQHADKQPVEPLPEEKHSSDIVHRATSMVSNIISSVTGALPSTTKSEDTFASYSTSDSDENEEELTESKTETTFDKTTSSTEPTIEESEIKPEEVTQRRSSTGFLDIMKGFIPSAIRRRTSIETTSDEGVPTVDEDKEVISSSTTETKTITEVSETYPVDSSQSILTEDQSSSDSTNVDISRTEKEPTEEVVEEKEPTSMMSRLTSAVSGAISAVQHALPTTTITSTADEHQQEKVPEDDQAKTTTESTVSE